MEFLIPNFSIYFKLPNILLNKKFLHRLIQLNPGRVHSTFDLYNNHRNEIQDYMIQDVLKRLIHGKECYYCREDSDDESESIDLNNIIQIINDYQHLQFDQL